MKEENLKEVPITIETAHQFFNKRQMAFIVKMFKQNYKEGFLNGRKLVVVFIISLSCYGQSSIVPAGNQTETFGEVFPIMQQLDTIEKEVSLGVPKYEIETPKPIVKKKLTLLDKIIIFIKKLLK